MWSYGRMETAHDPKPATGETPVDFAFLEGDLVRAVDLFRIRDLTWPFGPYSASWLKARIASSDLEAVRLHSLPLIVGESFRKLLAPAEVWKPRR